MTLNLDLLETSKEDLTVANYFICTVKWFCKKKGYGFALPGCMVDKERSYIEISNNIEVTSPEDFFNEMKQETRESISSEIFMHLSRADSDRITGEIKAGDVFSCHVIKTARGLQISEIYEYFSMQKRIADIKVCNASVKWFNKKSDFGFLTTSPAQKGNSNDIFLSGKRVREMGINPDDLMPHRRVVCSFGMEDGRRVAIKVQLENKRPDEKGE